MVSVLIGPTTPVKVDVMSVLTGLRAPAKAITMSGAGTWLNRTGCLVSPGPWPWSTQRDVRFDRCMWPQVRSDMRLAAAWCWLPEY